MSETLVEESKLKSIKDKIEREGYVVVPALLKPDEISRLREALYRHFHHSYELEGLGKHQPNAAVEIGGISWLFGHPAIVAVFRELYGRVDLIFTGNCDAHMNMLSWWHKDSAGCFAEDCFARSEWGLYRAGIYLQDHSSADGLTVKIGSHRNVALADGKSNTLSTQTGDVVFFDMRLTHAGQFATRLEMWLIRAGKKFNCTPAIAALRTAVRRLRGKPDKLSIFFTYAIPGPDAEMFCKFEIAAKKRRTSDGAAYLPGAVVELVHRSNVEIWPTMSDVAFGTRINADEHG